MNVIGRPLVTPRELNQGGTGTSELVFTSDGTTPVILRLPTSEQVASATGAKARRIEISAGGRVVGGTTTNYTPQLQFGTSATAASNTDLESGSAIAVDSSTGVWMIEWTGVISKDNILGGAGRFSVCSAAASGLIFTDWAVQESSITTADPDAAGTLGFVVTGTFSQAHASNAAYLDWFTLSVLD